MTPLLVTLALLALASAIVFAVRFVARRMRPPVAGTNAPVVKRHDVEAGAFPEPARLRDDVQFTVYRPRSVVSHRWYKLLVYAHRAEGPAPEGGWQHDLSERVRHEAAAELRDDAPLYRTATEDAAAPVLRDAELMFIPVIDGFTFNPPRIVLGWHEELHEAEFRMIAQDWLDGHTARGQLTIMSGPLVLAEMSLVIPVSRTVEADEQPEIVSVRPYRRVFASYSRNDAAVVQRLREYGLALGDRYLQDVTDIRAGELWEPRIEALIRDADVFQLFWSWHALQSEYVQRELRYALALERPNFVRPVYWQDPLPAAPERGMPPAALQALHFQRVNMSVADDAASAARAPQPARAARPEQPVPARPRAGRFPFAALTSAALIVLAMGTVGIYRATLRENLIAPPDNTTAVPGPQDTAVVALPPDPILLPRVDSGPRPAQPRGGGGGGRAVLPRPDVQLPRPVAPTATTEVTTIAPFTVPPDDASLARLALELQQGVARSWERGRALVVAPGADAIAAARAARSDVILEATLSRQSAGLRIQPRVHVVSRGVTRTGSILIVDPAEPPSVTAQRLAAAFAALLP